MTITEFLLARLDEDEAVAREAVEESAAAWEYAEHIGSMQVQTVELLGNPGYEYHVAVTFDQEGLSDSVTPKAGPHIARHDPARILAEVESKRRIVEWHENWPVLVQSQPEIEPVDTTDPHSFAYRASQQIAWMTEREYRTRFGAEPPTSPILRLLALPYANHPDYVEGWRP